MSVIMMPENVALIIVDVQNDFCPGGALAVPGGDEIIQTINVLKETFNTVVLTQDWHPKNHKSFASAHEGQEVMAEIDMPYGKQTLWPDHCVQGSYGAQFHAALNVQDNDLVLQKGTNSEIDSYSGFFENDGVSRPLSADGSNLSETLRAKDITKVVICGLAYDFCVGWHALDARKEGFEAVVLKDASRSIVISLDDGTTTQDLMTSQLQNAGVQLMNTPDLRL